MPESPPGGGGLLRRVSRFGQRLLALGTIRPPLRLLMQLAAIRPVPAVVDVPDARRVLVLAPHMDDETIGCGGAICAHVAAGAAVEVLYLTDGVYGFDTAVRRSHDDDRLRAIRREEAQRATDMLGVRKLHFLDLPDGRSRVEPEAITQLQTLVAALQPDLLYLPFIIDSHQDHVTANHLLFALLERDRRLRSLLCACYEVWTPLYPNCIVDISHHAETKFAALDCYRSQLAMNDYSSSVRGLNRYRALVNSSRGYAEAFYRSTAGDYYDLCREHGVSSA